MRIISGKFGGRRLTPSGRLPARPTTDKAKEALFNILSNPYYLPDMDVLDLFAGTGNISLEFVSRGCSSVVAVERSFPAVRFIKKVKTELDMPELQVVRADVFQYLKTETHRYDLIFADPPYDLDRKSTRLNSSHVKNSYAVFCLKKKTKPLKYAKR